MTGGARMRRTPIAIGIAILGAWELVVRLAGIAPSVLPGPLLVLETLWIDSALLTRALWITLEIALAALLAAAVSGAALAQVLTRARWIERGLTPFAVIALMTPIVAIAPLLIIWIGDGLLSRVAFAWIVAVFPVLAQTLAGLNGTVTLQNNLGDDLVLVAAADLGVLVYSITDPFAPQRIIFDAKIGLDEASGIVIDGAAVLRGLLGGGSN